MPGALPGAKSKTGFPTYEQLDMGKGEVEIETDVMLQLHKIYYFQSQRSRSSFAVVKALAGQGRSSIRGL